MERPFVICHCRTVQEPLEHLKMFQGQTFVSSAAVLRRMPTEHFKVRVAAFTVNLKKRFLKQRTAPGSQHRPDGDVIDELSRSKTHTES